MSDDGEATEARDEGAREAELLARGWPPALVRAGRDDGRHYALGLVDGTRILSVGAEPVSPDATWVRVTAIRAPLPRGLDVFARDLDVRVAAIAWVVVDFE
jgi:hypothetical protein